MKYFDAHSHAHFAAFKEDYKEVIQRALDAGVWMMNVGTQKDTSARGIEVAHEYKEGVYAAVGLHPVHTDRSYHDEKELGGGEAAHAFVSRGEVFDFDYYKKLAEDPKVLAIGECGLDYYRMDEDADKEVKIKKQKDALVEQIRLAHEVNKPLMIHCRKASFDIVDIFSAHRDLLSSDNPGVIHFYTDDINDAKKLLDLGFSFSLGGVITFARDYDEMVRMLPIDRILTETDAPYVAPAPYRGKRNEPAYVIEAAKKLAEIRGVDARAMAEQIVANTRRVLNPT